MLSPAISIDIDTGSPVSLIRLFVNPVVDLTLAHWLDIDILNGRVVVPFYIVTRRDTK